MTTYQSNAMNEYGNTKNILNKIAYADEANVNDSGITVLDKGKSYTFGIQPVARALGAPSDCTPFFISSQVLNRGRKISYLTV